MPCRTCSKCIETVTNNGRPVEEAVSLTCREGKEIGAVEMYGMASQEEGERVCEDYSHIPWEW